MREGSGVTVVGVTGVKTIAEQVSFSPKVTRSL